MYFLLLLLVSSQTKRKNCAKVWLFERVWCVRGGGMLYSGVARKYTVKQSIKLKYTYLFYHIKSKLSNLMSNAFNVIILYLFQDLEFGIYILD